MSEKELTLDDLTEDELETMLMIIKLDLHSELKLPPLECGGCTGEKGCC